MAPPAPTSNAAPSMDIVVLTRRGDELLKAGDIVPARQFYERAALAGDAAALCGMGKSYDPLYLRQLGAVGLLSSPATAMDWYRRAAAAGSEEARRRLAVLGARESGGEK